MISLVYSLKSPYRRNAKFLMHDQTISILRKLKDGNLVERMYAVEARLNVEE